MAQKQAELQQAYMAEASKPPEARNPRVEFEWASVAAQDMDTCARPTQWQNTVASGAVRDLSACDGMYVPQEYV